MSERITDPGEFLRGQRHCKQGLPHQPDQHPDYDRGYETEYVWQEIATHKTELQEVLRGH